MTNTLSDILGFTGRLGRLGFTLCLLGLILVALVAMLTLTEDLGLTISDTDGRLWDEPAADLTVVLPLYAVLIALTARRVRDIGWPVLPVLPGLTAIDLAEWFVLPRMTETRLPAPLDMFSPPGGVLSIAAMLWLLPWPGRREQASIARR